MNKSIVFFLALVCVVSATSCTKTTSDTGMITSEITAADFAEITSIYKKTKSIAGAGPQHGFALVGGLKYEPGFKHLDYANPDAPEGGTITLQTIGNFDSLNPFIIKGTSAPGMTLVFETLLERTLDEPSSEYGLIAESIEVPEDYGSATFVIRKEARWHDGTPITPEDVVFSFEKLTKEGYPFYVQYYSGVDSVKKTGDRKVTFFFKDGFNRELPMIVGELYIISKDYYQKHAFNAPSMEYPMGSGPYMVSDAKAGKSITLKRVPDYWGKDLPLTAGRYNIDTIDYIVFQDENVGFQGFKGLEFDFLVENNSKRWATEYAGPAFDKKVIVRELIPDKTPKGIQGFVFNTRREIFKDPGVREAIGLAFDFEWSNRNLFYGQYTRTKSYFENSVFASYLDGLPSKEELGLLEPLKGRVPDEVFTEIYMPPKTDGSGNIRYNLNKAISLFEGAGWVIKDTLLVNKATGKQMTFEISLDQAAFERIASPFVRNLEKMGIMATYRTVDLAQQQKRENEFEFDMIVNVWGESFSPGNEQREFWGSGAADQPGSRNLAGVKDPAIDRLIEALVSAKDFTALQAATRALDRVLLWNHFVVPHWYIPYHRIAYKDRFGKPEIVPPFGLTIDTWWIDPEKDKALASK